MGKLCAIPANDANKSGLCFDTQPMRFVLLVRKEKCINITIPYNQSIYKYNGNFGIEQSGSKIINSIAIIEQNHFSKST